MLQVEDKQTKKFSFPTIAEGDSDPGSGIAVLSIDLENQRVRIGREGGAFWLAGLADYESPRTKPSYTDTLLDLPEGEPVLALSHWPDAFAVAPDRVALTLAGHSHCGQVNLPFFGRLLHASPGSEKWPCGLYEERGRQLYVTAGVGTSILPVRFNQPPEIVLITLRKD